MRFHSTDSKRERGLAQIVANASIEYWVGSPNVAARLYVVSNNQPYIGLGFAKVSWPDKWDEGVGKQIAVRKAAKVIRRQLRGE